MPLKVDIIILSYAKDENLKALTMQTVKTLFESEDPNEVEFKVLVVESNKAMQPYQFDNTTTIYPTEEFGFNKYLNIGINRTSNPYICLCNNDLIFHKGWATGILKAMEGNPTILSATPYCPVYHKSAGFNPDGPAVEGYFGTFIGWCFMVKRELFDIIGPLDEKFTFWYSDADYCNTLARYGVKNYLVPPSVVTHIGSESLKATDNNEYKKLTQLPRFYYSYKWQHHSWLKYKIQSALFKLKLLIGL
ncbi:glycosyltransferase family 2 protein [Mucilaginibacter terrigena]|uniref:Glycosyltransferase family 2 protein n=1 Tax=Mucilaginibacter terrigena TaxID=2492395 RepID=A0A4Q5LQK5_9SPHI|nr:glycosyltransferase [Mucilaginibacter terrigena]RYU91623.1 glycosyltransferase family 2 protein [Mucilaginibacter terrigena]